MAKKIDPKAKAKKQKIYAAIGGVLLLGLLAFQVPRTMKMLNQNQGVDSAASSSTTAPTVTTTGPVTLPSLGGGNATASATPSGDGLNDPDAVPAAQSGQLLAFGRFRTKDPFAQQVDLSCGGDSTSCDADGSSGGSGSGTKAPPTSGGGAVPSQGGGDLNSNPSPGPAPAPAPAPAAKPTSATISVNGTSESVQVGGQFPSASPTFTLVSLTAKTAKVGIAGGSFEGGTQTVTLTKGKPLTLMNTADGTRYVLRLISVS
jgi:hypothetical protein